MCDSATSNGGDSGILSPDVAVGDDACMERHQLDAAASIDQLEHQRLLQTTQSLSIASSMMAGGLEASVASAIGNYNGANLFGSIESMNEPESTPPPPQSIGPATIEELRRENYDLRQKLKEISSDRDRLVCEVSNLRLELDMSELKRMPSFPQKSIEKNGSAQYGAAAPAGSTSSASSISADGSGYIYLQQHYAPSAVSATSSATVNYPVGPAQPHVIYHPQQYSTCHQQQQQLIHHQPINIANASGTHYGQHVNAHHSHVHAHPHQHQQHQQQHQQQHHQHAHHHIMHGHHHHHGGAVVIAGSGVGTGMGSGGGGTSPLAMQQNPHKKNTIRNGGDCLKRSRAQTAYELSQDLLEKQIELLERKYGGVRARNAAIIIQRAFRHYMMVKKFASITAMAKAEKRLSRMMVITGEDGPPSNSSLSSAYGSATESQLDVSQAAQAQKSQSQLQALQQQSPQQQHQQQHQLQHQPRVTIMAGPPGGAAAAAVAASSTGCASPGAVSVSGAAGGATARTPPTRSLSMRERRQLEGTPIPRSQSGASSVSSASFSSALGGSGGGSAHPHVNLLHAAELHYYSGYHMGGGAPPPGVQYYPTYHAVPHDASFTSSNSQLDSSLNVSWVSASGSSPHTPYYSAAQIYMRPKSTLTPAERKKVPPEVPKRTSSITAQQHAQQQLQQQQQMLPPGILRSNGLCKTSENGSLTSVQSSGSDSSVTSVEHMNSQNNINNNNNSDLGSDHSNSPNTWKRNTTLNSSQQFVHAVEPTYAHTSAQASPAPLVGAGGPIVISGGGGSGSTDEHAVSSHTSAAQYEQHEQQDHQLGASPATQNYKVSETIRKRQYRVGLNLFNKKPEKGITYLIRRGFLENTPQGVARFLISRKGLSRQMIGEYLGNLQNQFNMAVLNCFALELDLSGMQVDVALRKFQAYFRMPGEAQKIERLMEIFSHRYCQCNQDIVGRLRSSDTIFVLAFAIIMLNTDLHTPNLKPERRMRVEDFIKNLRGIDDCHDIDKDMLGGIFERVKANEFKPGSDHVTQVMKVQATIVGKKPNLALPHRRLVCYCRLYEIPDVNKKERPGVHQREVFLFNDLLVITKIFSKKKSSVTYTFRNSFPLCGMVVTLLDVPNYPFCIQLSQKVDGKILITFNARNEHDRCKFAEDLKESISEMDEMEALRIEAELERQKSARNRTGGGGGSSENRDSGVADVEVYPCQYQAGAQPGEPPQYSVDSSQQQLKRSALSNSLLDMHEQFANEKPQRRGSVGSLDSGMSISFQSTTTSSASRENAAVIAAAANATAAKMRFNLPAAGIYAASSAMQQAGMTHVNLVHHTHAMVMQSQNAQQQQQQMQQAQQQLILQQQQPPQHHHQKQVLSIQPRTLVPLQSPTAGSISGRERKLSRSEENGRSTEV